MANKALPTPGTAGRHPSWVFHPQQLLPPPVRLYHTGPPAESLGSIKRRPNDCPHEGESYERSPGTL
ncbi:hypothetical protein AUP68_01969 [Ilyonectria robusta]